MKKLTSLFLLLCASMAMWSATSSVPSQAPDVMLQAFYWDSYTDKGYGDNRWSTMLNQAEEIGTYFDLVWLPPCSQSSGGTGYIPKQYSNLNSDWGSETDLRSLISTLKGKDTRVVADIVVNHITGSSGWCSFATMNFGEYGTFYPDASWICKTDEMNYESSAGSCQGQATGANDDGYGDEANYTAARDWDHTNTNVQAMCRAYLKWLKNDVGFDGWRYDYGKGFHHSHINDYNSAAEAYLSVVEYWDGNSDVIRDRLQDASWNNMAFDFGTKYDALNNGICSFNYAKCKGAGMLGAGLRKHAVTFVDNHDTFQRASGSEFGGDGNSMSAGLKDRLLQANAYILSMPGIPCVFYPHWVTHKDAIKKMIEARHITGVHSESEVKDEYAEEGGYQATIVGKNGYIVLQLGNKASGTIDGFTKYASGNGYAIWTYVKQTEYYLKNNWGGGSDWSWKKMTAAGEGVFVLEDVIFGGNGVNYNTEASDAGAQWVALADIKGDAITSGDHVTFTLDSKTTTITAKKIEQGGGDEPGDDPEQPETPVDSMTVYFVNTLDWSAVNTFVWPAEGNAYKAWPGEAAKKEAEKVQGYDVYSYTFPASFVNVIFNNGTDQTVDLKWGADKPYFVPGEKEGDKLKGTWYAKADVPAPQGGGDEPGDDPEQPETPVDSMTVYFVNTLDWTTVNTFVWPAEGNAYKTWPGEAAKKEAEKVQGYDVYSYTFPATFVNVIFNNGTEQTVDLKWGADKPYFVPGEKEGDKLKGTWYAKADVPAPQGGGDEPGDDPEQPETPVDSMTVYFVNTLDWTTVNTFVWPAEGNAYKTWPGEAAKKEAEKVQGYDVYSYTFPASFVNVIFNNGTDQTVDLKWVADKPYFVPGEKEGNKFKGTWYAKADVPAPQGGGDEPGDNPEQPETPVDSMTVYFVNTLDWTTVNTFVWPAEGNAYKTWPGEAAKKEAEKVQGYDVYSYTFPASFVNVIFNNGTDQTADLKWVADKPYFVPGEKEGDKLKGTWYAKADVPAPQGGGDEPGDDPEQPETPVDSMTVYFVNTLDWSAVNTFVWPAEGNAYKTWPGEAAKKEAEKVQGYDVYAYTFPASFVNVIFNNGTEQTADLKWVADKPYFVPGEKKDGKYEGTWYAKADVPAPQGGGEEPGDDPEQPETLVDSMTVYFVNTLDWSAVNTFVWPAEGNAYKTWPGEAAKKEAEKVQGYDVYSYTFPATFVNVIFNNGTDQTVDLKWVADKPYFVPGEKKEGKYAGTWYAKADVPAPQGGGDEPGDDPGDDPEPTITDGFYLMGTMNGWKAEEGYLFVANELNPGEYYLNVTLTENDELKVAKVAGGEAKTWYPGGDNYIVDAAHAGAKTIYFQETYKPDWESFGGYFYIEKNTATSLDNYAVEGQAAKVIVNGQLFILRNGKTYTITGLAR